MTAACAPAGFASRSLVCLSKTCKWPRVPIDAEQLLPKPNSQPASSEPDALRDPHEHTFLEDAYALLTGTTLVAIGLVLMKAAGIVTAGIAGLALLLSYAVPLGVGLLFFLLNIPFFALGMRALGREFMVKSVLAALLIFALASLAQESLEISFVHPAFAALAGGT